MSIRQVIEGTYLISTYQISNRKNGFNILSFFYSHIELHLLSQREPITITNLLSSFSLSSIFPHYALSSLFTTNILIALQNPPMLILTIVALEHRQGFAAHFCLARVDVHVATSAFACVIFYAPYRKVVLLFWQSPLMLGRWVFGFFFP